MKKPEVIQLGKCLTKTQKRNCIAGIAESRDDFYLTQRRKGAKNLPLAFVKILIHPAFMQRRISRYSCTISELGHTLC